MSDVPPPSDPPVKPKRRLKATTEAALPVAPRKPAATAKIGVKPALTQARATATRTPRAKPLPEQMAGSTGRDRDTNLVRVAARGSTRNQSPAPAHALEASDSAPPPWADTPVAEATQPSSKGNVGRRGSKPPSAHPADASTRSMRVIEWLTSGLRDPWRERSREYLVLMRMDRPVGALLLLWPTLWGLWFAANDFPPIGALIIFSLGVFVMRAAGCVINDYADHGWLDGNVERTRNRPMAAGRVSKKEALLLFFGLLGAAFVLVLFTNALTIKLSFGGAALAAIYPFCKRYTHLAQVVLGAAFGWSIPMAFAAVSGEVPALGWLLFLANVLFSTIYDTEYAMVDREDDIRVGAKSTAILFADADRPILAVLMLTFLFAMLLCGTRAELDWPYFVGLGIAAALFAWQQWLIRKRKREACFAAFRNNNWIGFVLWVGLLLALAIR